MSHDQHLTVPGPNVASYLIRLDVPFSEMSADQADGFAPTDDAELPGPDLNDDRGYGHGV